MSPWIAAHAASFIGSGIGKSGKPCARLIAPYWFEMRVISRITDSVNVLARFAAAARAERFWVLVIGRWLSTTVKLTPRARFDKSRRGGEYRDRTLTHEKKMRLGLIFGVVL